MTRRTRRYVALGALLATGACFHYVPTSGPTARGTPIRAELSRPLPIELSEITANNVVSVRGEVVANGTERLVLSVFGLRSVGGFEFAALGETVSLPTDAIAELYERRFSLGHTALAAAVLTVAGYAFQLTIRGAIGGGEPGDGPGDAR